MSKKLRIESQKINSESENDNGFKENASIYNRTESEIDLSTKNLQEVESDLTYMYDDQNTIKSLICSLCKARYKASNSPGTLATHLRTKHKEKAELVQAILDKFASKPYSKQDQRYKELTDSIVDFIICCQLPFAI
ncbi:10189_t:CDS:2, partial [Cetraspora pellucida]